MPRNIPPRYLAMEGADGAGKSSQLKLLVQAFAAADVPYVTTREPGGLPVGEDIRKILVTGNDDKLDAITETLLLSANRHEIIRQLVTPSLASGTWVISDRTFLSTYGLQGGGRQMDVKLLETLTEIAIGPEGGPGRPHLHIVLDVPAEVGLARKNPLFSEGLDESRFESIGLAFHQRTRAAYQAYVRAHPETTVTINATASIASVHHQIIAELNRRYGLSLQPQS